MYEHIITLGIRRVRFEIEVFPDKERAYTYIAIEREKCGVLVHPPFCVELDPFIEPSGIARCLQTTKGEVVPMGTAEVWRNPNIDGAMVAELILEKLKRPKREDQDKAFDPNQLRDFLIRCYEQYELRVFRIRHSTIILKPIGSLVTPKLAAEIVHFNRRLFGPASSRRTLKTFVQGFVESNIVIIGYD